MEPIHQAGWDGDVATIDRLVTEDGERLNTRHQGDLRIEGYNRRECTPLMLAAYRGQDAVVERLLALGADMGLQSVRGWFATYWACCGMRSSSLALLIDAGASITARDDFSLTPLLAAAGLGAATCVTVLLARFGDGVAEQLAMVDNNGKSAAHLACWYKHPSILALLLDAGASMDARDNAGQTPLMAAVAEGAADCMTMLLARVGDGVNAQDDNGITALDLAAYQGHHQAVSLLLHAGADPTIRTNWGQTPLETAQAQGHHQCVALLQAALAEPQRPRALFKARALLDAAHATKKARTDAQTKGHPAAVQQQEAMAAAPLYLRGRVAQAQDLPAVQVVEGYGQASEDEELVACLKYALGLEGGGGVVFEGQEPAVGMLPEVCVELLELLVPKWGPAAGGGRVERATGRGMGVVGKIEIVHV